MRGRVHRVRWPLWLQVSLLIMVAGTLPLAISGFFSLRALRAAAGREVEAKSRQSALRAAELLRRHVLKYHEMLIALAGSLEVTTHLKAPQVERILKNHILDVHDFRAIDLVAPDGNEIATGRADGATRSRSDDPAFRAILAGQTFYFSPVRIGTNVEPEMVLAVPIRTAGRLESALIATVNLTEMWGLVEDLALDQGTTKVVDRDGRLIAASGDLDKEAVFDLVRGPVTGPLHPIALETAPRLQTYTDIHGTRVLAGAAPIPELRWGVILEQPVSVAFASVDDQQRRLTTTVAAFLLLTILAGALGARMVTRPLFALEERTLAIARGELAGRVDPRGAREIAALGESINRMSQELIRLQDEMRSRERLSTFARFGAGLVHDLGTPIKALQMNAMLAIHAADDTARTSAIDRLLQEQKVIERYLQLIRAYARGEAIELRPILVDANQLLERIAVRARARWPQVEIEARPAGGRTFLYIDPGFIERVMENLAKNAVEAMAGRERRRIELGVEPSPNGAGPRTVLCITDTGCGIDADRMARLFEPFRSGKATGLGIGLALSHWIVKESGGEMSVESRLGEGTTFRVALPAQPPS